MNLCGDGVGREDGIDDEDQCPPGLRVCVKLFNRKDSAPQPERITQVIPLWPQDIPDDRVWLRPMGTNGQDGLRIWVEGEPYAEAHQHLNLTLRCDPSASEPNPSIVSYQSSRLTLDWASPDACPRSTGGGGGQSDGGSESRTGWGFWGLLRFFFWLFVVGLVAYFALGVLYNHQQYSARGWDLIPHRDFWREFPLLLQDLFSHLFAGLRGSGARGGYSSLG